MEIHRGGGSKAKPAGSQPREELSWQPARQAASQLASQQPSRQNPLETKNTNEFIGIFGIFGLEMQNTNEFICIFGIFGLGRSEQP